MSEVSKVNIYFIVDFQDQHNLTHTIQLLNKKYLIYDIISKLYNSARINMLIFSLFTLQPNGELLSLLLFFESIFLTLLIRTKMFILAHFHISFSLIMPHLDVCQHKTNLLCFILSQNDQINNQTTKPQTVLNRSTIFKK